MPSAKALSPVKKTEKPDPPKVFDIREAPSSYLGVAKEVYQDGKRVISLSGLVYRGLGLRMGRFRLIKVEPLSFSNCYIIRQCGNAELYEYPGGNLIREYCWDVFHDVTGCELKDGEASKFRLEEVR